MKANSPMSFMKARQKRTLKRTNSCPDWHEIEDIGAKNLLKINWNWNQAQSDPNILTNRIAGNRFQSKM